MIPAGNEAFRWGDYRYRLISLFEIMKKIEVAGLFEHSAGLARLSGSPSLFEALAVGEPPGTNLAELLRHPALVRQHVDYLRGIGAACKEAELNVSLQAVESLIGSYEGGFTDRDNIEPQYNEIRRTMERELRSRVFLLIEPSKQDLYEDPLRNWRRVLAAFPSIQSEIEEASKCLALDRSTACVFHALKILEPAIRAIANSVGVGYQPTWEAYLNKLHDAWQQKYPDKQKDSEWRKFYADVEAHFYVVKDAWRNTTMHEPARAYLEWQASSPWIN